MVFSANSQQLRIKRVSQDLMYQIRLEAEAGGVTMRAWVLRTLREVCGLPLDGEEVPRRGRSPKREV
jgi:hypothetical protein